MSDESQDPGDAEFFGPLERSGAARGWALVIVAVVLGALLMPSATRTSLQPAAAASTGSTTGTQSLGASTTAPPTTTTTTTVPHTTSTAPASIPASSIRVLVANGTNSNGAASSVTSFLSGKGFATLRPANALTTVHASQVYPINNAVTAAQEVAAALGLPSSSVQPNSTPVPVSSTAGATVVVIVGPDLLSRSSSTSSGA